MSQASLTQSRFLESTFYVCITIARLVGATNYSFDYKRKKFILQSAWQQGYCASLHVSYLLILPFALNSSYVRESAFEQRTFHIILNVVIALLRLPAFFLTLFSTWLHGKKMFEVIYRFEALRLSFFYTLSEPERWKILKHNDVMLYLKLFSSTSLIFTFFLRVFLFVENPSIEFICCALYFGVLEVVCLFKMDFFYVGMCYANCVMRYLCAELYECRQHLTASKVRELSQVYMEVGVLVRELRNIFQWEILSIALATEVGLIALFFNFILKNQHFDENDTNLWNALLFIFSLSAAFANIFDTLLNAFVCCNTIKCTKRIRDVLLVLHIQPELQERAELQREFNFLALQLSVNQPYVNVCGFFNLTSAMTFAILKGALSYLIVLVQADYRNW